VFARISPHRGMPKRGLTTATKWREGQINLRCPKGRVRCRFFACDGFPSPSQLPPQRNPKLRCPPVIGASLTGLSFWDLNYPAEFSRLVVSSRPCLRSKRILADRRVGVVAYF